MEHRPQLEILISAQYRHINYIHYYGALDVTFKKKKKKGPC